MTEARVVVDSRTRLLVRRVDGPSLLPDGLEGEIRTAFEHANPQWQKRKAMQLPVGDEERVDRTWRSELDEEGWWLSLPRGGLRRLVEVLRRYEIVPRYEDRRTEGEPDLAGRIPPHRFASEGRLFDYQREAIAAAVCGQNCLVRSSTGSGKTSLSLALVAQLNLPSLVIVAAGSLFDQWVERCWTELGIEPHEVGMVREGIRILKPLTIAMEQSLHAHPEWVEQHRRTFGLVLYDEVQQAAAKTVFSVVDRWESKYRIGVSNDERRPDGKEYLIYDLFGRVALDVPRERCEREGHIMPVDLRVVPTEFEAPWYRAAMAAGGRRRALANKRLMDEMCANAERNKLVVDLAASEAVKGESVLVLSHRREHCHLLDASLAKRGARGGLLIGGKDYQQRFIETRDGLKDGVLRVGCGTYKAVGMATDIPALSRAVLATPIASSLQPFDQARGRLTRVRRDGGKKSAPLLYYLDDQRVHGLSHLRNLAKWYGERVTVLDSGEWVSARDYLRKARRSPPMDPELEGLFDG